MKIRPQKKFTVSAPHLGTCRYGHTTHQWNTTLNPWQSSSQRSLSKFSGWVILWPYWGKSIYNGEKNLHWIKGSPKVHWEKKNGQRKPGNKKNLTLISLTWAFSSFYPKQIFLFWLFHEYSSLSIFCVMC